MNEKLVLVGKLARSEVLKRRANNRATNHRTEKHGLRASKKRLIAMNKNLKGITSRKAGNVNGPRSEVQQCSYLQRTIEGYHGDMMKTEKQADKQVRDAEERARVAELALQEIKEYGLSVLAPRKRGQKCSYHLQELCLRLMGRGITPNSAIGVLRDVRSAEAAKNNTEVSEDGYVLPSESYFKHQRLMLYQICHHLGVLALESADQWHSSHDAATKKRIGVFHHSVRAEKDGHVLDFPQSFSMIKNGETATEADAVQNGLTSTLVVTVSASLKKGKSYTSDNAAKSVSEELKARARKEWEADPQWTAMSPEMKASALDVYVLTCTNHSMALISTAFFANESEVLARLLKKIVDMTTTDEELQQNLAAACQNNLSEMNACETTTVSQLLRAVSKLFASHGDCGNYFLSEHESLVAYVKEQNAMLTENFLMGSEDTSLDIAPALVLITLHHLPSFKGSRMHILLELAEAIVRNRPIYLKYMSTVRVGSSENKLLTAVWNTLSLRPVYCALLARVIVWRGLIKPARLVLNHLAKRPEVHTVLGCMHSCITNLNVTAGSSCHFRDAVKQSLPEFASAIDS